jgi:GlpG protein
MFTLRILGFMKKIGTVPSEEDHEAFARLLTGKGIDFQSDSLADGVEFWAIEEEDHKEAQGLLVSYQANPASPEWKESLSLGKKVQAEGKKEDLRKKVKVGAFKVKHSGQGAKISLSMIYISVGIFLVSLLNPRLGDLIYYWAIFSLDGNFSGLAQGQIWRVLTPIFLHFGPLHILFNSMWMYDLGRSFERKMGSPFFVLFVLLTGGLSNFLQYNLSGPQFGGLSGVVYGLLGYIWVRGRRDSSFGLGISSGTMTFMMGWLVLGVLAPDMRMANGAHFGGLVIGVLLAFFELKRRRLL